MHCRSKLSAFFAAIRSLAATVAHLNDAHLIGGDAAEAEQAWHLRVCEAANADQEKSSRYALSPGSISPPRLSIFCLFARSWLTHSKQQKQSLCAAATCLSCHCHRTTTPNLFRSVFQRAVGFLQLERGLCCSSTGSGAVPPRILQFALHWVCNMVDYSKWNKLVDSDDEGKAEMDPGQNSISAAAAAEGKQCCKSDAAQDHLQLGDAAFGQADFKTALEEYEQVLLLDGAACSTDKHLVTSTLNKAAATLIRLNSLTVADQAFNCPLSSVAVLMTTPCCAAHRRYEEAEALASRVLSKEPACRQALQLRGEARLKQCKPRIAMLDLSTALPLANGADERNETARLLEAAEAAAGAE
eukprot:13412-Heterococcus_DN1.PRE.3